MVAMAKIVNVWLIVVIVIIIIIIIFSLCKAIHYGIYYGEFIISQVLIMISCFVDNINKIPRCVHVCLYVCNVYMYLLFMPVFKLIPCTSRPYILPSIKVVLG